MNEKEFRDKLRRRMDDETVSPSLKHRTLSRIEETRRRAFRPAAFACTAAVMAAAFLCLFALKQNLLPQSEPMNSPAAFAAPNATVTAAFDPVSPTPILEGTPDPTQVPALQATPITEADPTETPVLWTTSTPMPCAFFSMDLIDVVNTDHHAELTFRLPDFYGADICFGEVSVTIPADNGADGLLTFEYEGCPDGHGGFLVTVFIDSECSLSGQAVKLHFGGPVSGGSFSPQSWDFFVTLNAPVVEFGSFDLPDGRTVLSFSVASDRIRCTYTESDPQNPVLLGITTQNAVLCEADFSRISRSVRPDITEIELIPKTPLDPAEVTGLCFLDESTGEILSCLGLPQNIENETVDP